MSNAQNEFVMRQVMIIQQSPKSQAARAAITALDKHFDFMICSKISSVRMMLAIPVPDLRNQILVEIYAKALSYKPIDGLQPSTHIFRGIQNIIRKNLKR
jgi:hypothetical protein